MDFLQLLPHEVVLNHIINILDVTTRVRAALVCRAWRNLVEKAPLTISNMPWLFLFESAYPMDPFARRCPNNEYYLLDVDATPATAGSYSSRPLQYYDAIASGGSYMTLVSTKVNNQSIVRCDYKIYNPFTQKTIPLPTSCPTEYLHCAKFLFSSDPPDCLVAAWDSYQFATINLFRPGDEYKWIEGPQFSSCGMHDMIFFNGQLYGINNDLYVIAYDINLQNYKSCSSTTGRIAASCHHFILNDLQLSDFYLVESNGELLVVTHTHLQPKGSTFMVHRLDEEKGELVRVLDLGERMLFLRQGGSIARSGRRQLGSDSFFSNNCIYFFKYKGPRYEVFVGKFELGTTSPQFHPKYRFNRNPIWVPPPHPKYS